MPGANCSIFGCSTSRKSKGIAIFKVPSGDDEYNKTWRDKIVTIITRDREIDTGLKRQIDAKTLHVCELHYPEESLIRNANKTTRIPGTLPTLNLPVKSFTVSKTERSTTSIEKRVVASAVTTDTKVQTDCYKSFEDFNNRVVKLKLPLGWEIKLNTRSTTIRCMDSEFVIPKYQIFVKNDLSYNLLIYNWEVKFNTKCNMKNKTLSALIKEINEAQICEGVDFKSDNLIKHSVPKLFSPTTASETAEPLTQVEYWRPLNCFVLCEKGKKCKICHEKELQYQRQMKKKAEKALEPAKLNAPISLTSPDRVKLSMQNYRIENKQLNDEIKKLQQLIKDSAVPASKNLDDDLKSIMSNADPSKVSPFMKFFWQEQQKYLQSSSTGVRYHPAVIRYCLSLAAKSSSAYEDLRYNEKTGTGCLILPSKRRLRDYKNYIRPKRGFNSEIIQELKRKTADFSDSEKHVTILLDEMKIQESLVWDKHTGELIGFVDLGDQDVNYATLENVQSIASHVLVFMIRSIVNPLKFSLATFATTGATAAQLFPLIWKAIAICELTCNLKVMTVTCDGASTNRKLFSMHSEMVDEKDINPDVDVTYRVRNMFSPDRFVYFISDPPHLIKTARNCIANSGAGRCSRFMWNDGSFILWSHIKEMFYDDQNHGLHLLPKLTYDHINLTSYSIMNVRLAVQVLSTTVSNVLKEFGPAEAAGTAKFCMMMDSFFDIANIRNTSEHKHKSKPLLAPIASPDDERLTWLVDGFLGYFKKWQQSIDTRPGNFTKSAKEKMFISRQTYAGLKITTHSIVECTRYLLRNKVCSYVLTEKFCQDPLENYFGRQRALGARKDNPTLRDVGYNDNSIRNQKVFRPVAGNVGGADKAVVEISNEPLPCRKRRKVNNVGSEDKSL